MNPSLKKFIGLACAAVALVAGRPAQAGAVIGSVPLWFEQSGPDNGTFTAHTRSAQFQVTASGADFILRKPGAVPATVRMTFAGGTTGAEISASDKLNGTINYFTGNDPAQWRPAVPAFADVRLANIYPGVDVVYYGDSENLEYDFNLAAGVRPETIAIRFDGAEKISINAEGQLVITAGGGKIIQHKPVAYQTVSGKRQEVNAAYKIADAHTAIFSIGTFNHSLPLTIDPVLGYSTYFGGNFGEDAVAVAVNPTDDSIFIAGRTFSTQVTNNVPFATSGVVRTNFQGNDSVWGDAFVAHFDQTGTNLLYCTYLGGSKDDTAFALAVDTNGDAFVGGGTESTNFPVSNALRYGNYNGSNIAGINLPGLGVHPLDGFVTELAPDGSSLIYSTYLGGSSLDVVEGIAVDGSGNAFVTGYTLSSNFPVTLSTAYQTKLQCTNNFFVNGNAFVSEIGAGGTNLIYSTYLGGTNIDVGFAICYNSNRVFVAGQTISTNFPQVKGLTSCMFLNGNTNVNKHSSTHDGFVAAFSIDGTNLELQYSTFLGGSNEDVATGIDADSSGNAYVVGWTVSSNFPASTVGVQLSSFVRTNTAGAGLATNAFLTKISYNWATTNQNAVVDHSQIFGGRGYDVANGVKLDSGGNNIFVIGSETSQTNYNAIGTGLLGALSFTNSAVSGTAGTADAFVTVVKSDFSALVYSACIGGKKEDFGNAIAVDNEGNAIIAGSTASTNFPVFGAWTNKLEAVHNKLDGTNDTFIARILTSGGPALQAGHAGTNAVVFWPTIGGTTPSQLPLETTTNAAGTNWIIVTDPVPVLNNGNYIYTFNPTNPMRFFRFHH